MKGTIQLKICKEFVKKIATQKDAIDRYYKMFYNDNKCVFSHLKLRQDKDNPLYEYEILGKKIHINNENKTHIFGPFDNVFDYRLSNEEISTKLFKESDHHSNIIKQLENDEFRNKFAVLAVLQAGSYDEGWIFGDNKFYGAVDPLASLGMERTDRQSSSTNLGCL